MAGIKRFFECLLPVTVCNLRCSYCYVIQRNRRNMKLAAMKYTPQQIGAALNPTRLGGECFFSICGEGETTLQPELPEIVYQLLSQGHYVNITTNGTVGKKITDILNRNSQYTSRLQFAFSFHYLELIRLNLIDEFFKNVQRVKDAGASFFLQINLCDEYMPHIEAIKQICVERTGAVPQVAATRKEENGLQRVELLTTHTYEEYTMAGKSFQSPLFDFTMKNFNIKRKEFCYAGDWAANLDLSTGIMRRCYCSYIRQDIFKNPNEKINFLAVGNSCGSPFCMNSSHFMSLGVIPEIDTPTYVSLRDRKGAGWYTEEMKGVLSSKLSDENHRYSKVKQTQSNFVGFFDNITLRSVSTIRRLKSDMRNAGIDKR